MSGGRAENGGHRGWACSDGCCAFVEPAALGLAYTQSYGDREQDAGKSQDEEGGSPAIEFCDRSSEGETKARACDTAHPDYGHSACASVEWKVVAEKLMSRRATCALGRAHADSGE